MLAPVMLLAVTIGAQGGVPAQIIYRVRVADTSGVFMAPVVRTLDGERVTLSFTHASGTGSARKSRTYEMYVVPHVDRNGRVVSDVEVNGAAGPALDIHNAATKGDTLYVHIAAARHGSADIVATASGNPPSLRGDDIGVSIVGSTYDDATSDGGDTAVEHPQPVRYEVVLRDSRGVVATPTVLTLDRKAATISARGNDVSYSISLVPRFDRDGRFQSFVRVWMGSDVPITFVTKSLPSTTYAVVVTHPDHGLTTRSQVVRSGHVPRLGPGDYYVSVSGKLVTAE